MEFFVGPGRELFEDITEVGERLNAIELARFDDAVEGRGPFTTSVITHEQEILSIMRSST